MMSFPGNAPPLTATKVSTDEQYLRKRFQTFSSLYWVVGGWNTATVRSAIDAHDAGSGFSLSGALAIVASRYPTVFAALRQRKDPPTGLAREVTGGLEGKARIARDGFAKIMRKNEDALLDDILDARAMLGFSVLQTTQIYDEERNEQIPCTEVFPAAACFVDPSDGQLYAWTMDGRVPIRDGDGKWSVIGQGLNPQHDGAIRAVGGQVAAAWYAERDEAALSEFLGRLCPIAILPEGVAVDDELGVDIGDAIKELGKAKSGGIFQHGVDVKTLANTDAGAAALFGNFLERRSKAMARIILGTDGTMSPGSPGVYTSPVFAGVSFSVIRADTVLIARAFTRIGQIYGLRNYGLGEDEAPGFRWLLPDPTEAERRKALAQAHKDFNDTVDGWKKNGFAYTQADVDALARDLGVKAPRLPPSSAAPGAAPDAASATEPSLAERYKAFNEAVAAERANNFLVDQARVEQLAAEHGVKAPRLPEANPKGGEIFAYHITEKIVAPDQVLERLGLPPLPLGAGSVERLAQERLANAATASESEPQGE